MIVQNTIRHASQLLKNGNIVSHELDAELILSDIMGIRRELLIIKNDQIVSNKVITKFNHAIKRRLNNEPVAYIIGEKEFWSKNFTVTRDTLIPRPETELLIYKLIDLYKNKIINILDIGTGSGCILISILKELNKSRGIGIDISSKAIKTAKLNSKKFNLLNRAKFKVCDMNKFNLGKYDLIVSNPPYIPLKELKNLSRDITGYEPLKALNGGLDGCDLIRKVINRSSDLLKKNGVLAIEIGYNQYRKVSTLLRRDGFREISIEYDFNKNVRCIISTKVGFF